MRHSNEALVPAGTKKDVALKIVLQGTKCYTIALCGKLGHVDAGITLRDTGMERIKKLAEIIRKKRAEEVA